MSIQESVVGLIEVDVAEGRNLAMVLDSLMTDTNQPAHTAMCRVRRDVLPATRIPADLSRLSDSLIAEHQVAVSRLGRSM
jgi:hypothetical protein